MDICAITSFSNLRRFSSENPVDVVVAFSQAGTMLAIYMDEMRKALGGDGDPGVE